MKLVGLLVSVLLLSGCTTFKKKALLSMAGGFIGGYAAGNLMAPEGDNRHLHGVLVGSSLSALIGAGMIYFLEGGHVETPYNSGAESFDLSKYRSIKSTDRELIQNRIMSTKNYDKLPENLKKKIRAGKWKVYVTDEWYLEGNKLTNELMKVELSQ